MTNAPLSEQWHLAANNWAKKEAAASLLEETKSAVLSQYMMEYGDIAVSKAEMLAKASLKWKKHINDMVEAREEANLAWVEREYLRMKFFEWQSAEATNRVEARL